jgi:hemerythrin-like domain-containing protein
MASEDPNNIGEAFGEDHRRLEELRERAGSALAAGRPQEAGDAFAEFDRGLRHHISVEEELLFPALERDGGLRREFGPTGVMISEHRAIESLLDQLGRIFSGGTDAQADGAARMSELTAILEAHDAKEEMVLYPMADRVIDTAERDSIVARIRKA